jgi:hypothetical protein
MNSKKFNITGLFELKTGDFHATKELEPGDIPLISCGKADNGLTGYYDIPENKRYSHALTVAYNGTYAFTSKFHPYSFGAKDDVAVLQPKSDLNDKTLIYVAAMFNQERWRYSYSRKCFKNKLSSVEIDLPSTEDGEIDEAKIAEILEPIKAVLPKRREEAARSDPPTVPEKWVKRPLSEHFTLQQGDFNALPSVEGDIPTVSRLSENNGIKGYFEPPEGAEIYDPPRITVSTTSGKAFVQTEPFISSDKVVILTPKDEQDISIIYFFQLAIDYESWRYSYGRSCFKSKLQDLKVYLPMDAAGELDTEYMKWAIESTEYWDYLSSNVRARQESATT